MGKSVAFCVFVETFNDLKLSCKVKALNLTARLRVHTCIVLAMTKDGKK